MDSHNQSEHTSSKPVHLNHYSNPQSSQHSRTKVSGSSHLHKSVTDDPDFSRNETVENRKLFMPNDLRRSHQPPERVDRPKGVFETLQSQEAASSEKESSSYNPGLKNRLQNIPEPELFFRRPITGGDQEVVAQMMMLLQKVQDKEMRQNEASKRLKSKQANSITDEEWARFTTAQFHLIEHYCDILFCASSINGNNLRAHEFIKINKIPTRFWNQGISSFIDIIRNIHPHSTTTLGDFVMTCANYLVPLTDDIYDTKHVWMESLGDLALICLLSKAKGSEWSGMGKYWYSKRSILTPGTGRVYRHLFTASADNVDRLFYLCKSSSCSQPIEFSRQEHDILSRHVQVEPRSDQKFDARYFKFISQVYTRTLMEIRTDFDESIFWYRPAATTFCNISALLAHGQQVCSISRYLNIYIEQKQNKFDTSYLDLNTIIPTSYELELGASARKLAFKFRKVIIRDKENNKETEHRYSRQTILIWLYFLLAMSKVPRHITEPYFDIFPFEQFTDYVNDAIRQQAIKRIHNTPNGPIAFDDLGINYDITSVKKHNESGSLASQKLVYESLKNYPDYTTWPFPEEIHMRGFSWYYLLPNFPHFRPREDFLDEPFVAARGEDSLDELRSKRIRSLARRLGEDSTWFTYSSSTLEFTGFEKNRH